MAFKTFGLIVLAAGESSRMGTPKQLLPFQGKSLLEHVLDQTSKLAECVRVVVLGSQSEQMLPIVNNYGNHVSVTNAGWKNGMGSSIKEGLSFIRENHPDLDAVVFMTCDQPEITSHHLQNLISQYQEHACLIVSTGYNNIEGVPALFDRKLFAEIMRIDDNEGARKIIANCPQGKKIIAHFPLAAIDLDTKADVEHYLQQRSTKP